MRKIGSIGIPLPSTESRVVDMDEGYQMLANIVGCDVADVAVGLRVGVEFHPVADGYALPYFRPV